MTTTATCVHGKPIDMTPEEQCFECQDLIAENVRRQDWLDGMIRFTEFFRNHPEFIPKSGGAYVVTSPYNDAYTERMTVLALKEAAGGIERGHQDPGMVAVKTTAFAPHTLTLKVAKEAVGRPVPVQTSGWDWDAEVFGDASA